MSDDKNFTDFFQFIARIIYVRRIIDRSIHNSFHVFAIWIFDRTITAVVKMVFTALSTRSWPFRNGLDEFTERSDVSYAHAANLEHVYIEDE